MSQSPPPGETSDKSLSPPEMRWYQGITRYQWMVLVMGALGWMFDAFEGQLFVVCMKQAIPTLIPDLADNAQAFYEHQGFAAFLIGGAVGGFFFGWLSDRIGRSTVLMLTILTYSIFTGITYFVDQWWQMLVLRFLAALGTGGEWAVASAMVAEAFPPRSRARAASIFHASSVFGTMIATLIGAQVVSNPNYGWRVAFVIGALPALICVFIRAKLHNHSERRESESEHAAANKAFDGESAWRQPGVMPRLLLGVMLATVGLATFWGVHIYGREAYLRSIQIAHELTSGELLPLNAPAFKTQEMLGMWLVTLGGGVGLFAFGPICDSIGRRRAFMAYHLAAALTSIVLFSGLKTAAPWVIAWWLPLFGFATLGMHAGYAVYFPELFPSRIRGAAGGFCFNFARITAVPALFLSGWMQKSPDAAGRLLHIDPALLTFHNISTAFSLLFLVGIVLIWFGPETKGQSLPE